MDSEKYRKRYSAGDERGGTCGGDRHSKKLLQNRAPSNPDQNFGFPGPMNLHRGYSWRHIAGTESSGIVSGGIPVNMGERTIIKAKLEVSRGAW
jgi:hypothetical protein